METRQVKTESYLLPDLQNDGRTVRWNVKENSFASNSVLDWNFKNIVFCCMCITTGHFCTKTHMSICKNKVRLRKIRFIY
jgi:hypothetical protein